MAKINLDITPDGIEHYIGVKIPFFSGKWGQRNKVCEDLAFYCSHKGIAYKIEHHSGNRSVLKAEGAHEQITALLDHIGAFDEFEETKEATEAVPQTLGGVIPRQALEVGA